MLQLKKYPALVGGVNVQQWKHCQKLIRHLMKVDACRKTGSTDMPVGIIRTACFHKAYLDSSCKQFKVLAESGYASGMEVIDHVYKNLTVIQISYIGDGGTNYLVINSQGYIINMQKIANTYLEEPISLKQKQAMPSWKGFNEFSSLNHSASPSYHAYKYVGLSKPSQFITSIIPFGTCMACGTIYEGLVRLGFDTSGKLLSIQVARLRSVDSDIVVTVVPSAKMKE